MPNPANVDAPVTLVGPGRSGTTLVTRIFRKHSEFFSIGESVNLVYGSYRQLTRQLNNTGPIPGGRSIPEAARDAVHAMLCATYPSDEPRWFQKPIHLPGVHRGFDGPDDFGAWYWETAAYLFPRGRFLTVAREPAALAASAMVRWNETEAQAFDRIRSNLQLMLHPASRLGFVMRFEQLEDAPDVAVRQLLAFAGATYEESVLSVFERQHAVNPDIERPTGLKVPTDVARLYDELLARI